MSNPLHKRFKRQLIHDAGKHLGIFCLLVVTAGVISGFLATLTSISAIVSGMDETYAIEDARFETTSPLSDEARSAAEAQGARIYDNWSRDADAEIDGADTTIRVYRSRTEIDLASIFEGRLPETADEIALDHTFCSHHGLKVGDTVTLGGQAYTISGIMVLSDYTSLMRSNTDVVMDAVTFSVAVVTDEGFSRLEGLPTAYVYSVAFDSPALTTKERTEREADLAQALTDNSVELSELLDRDQNQGISYLGTDMEGDRSIYLGFFFLLILVMAFVFVIVTNATIEQESSVIGTLLASGWRKSEILRHYLFLPSFIGVVSIAVGNILGYTVFSSFAQGLYYGSYSLPPFEATFDIKTFLLTSVLPLAMLILITAIGLARKLSATPLAFLRHEVSHGARRHQVHLPDRLGYVARFRLRVLIRSIPTFVTLFAGVLVGSVLVMFSLTLLPMFEDYAQRTAASMPVGHIYTLKAPYELEMTAEQQGLRDQLERMLGVSYGADALSGAGESLREGAAAAGSGASTIADGAHELAQGAGTLSDGATALASGSDAFAAGLSSAAASESQAAASADLSSLQSAYEGALQAYVGTYLGAYGASFAATGDAATAAAAASSDSSVAAAQQALAKSLSALVQGAGEKGGAAGAAAALEEARSDYTELALGISSLSEGTSQLANGAQSLGSGADGLKEGFSELSGGISDYTSGVDSLLGMIEGLGLDDMAKSLEGTIHPVADDGTFTQEEIGQAEKLCLSTLQTQRRGNAGMEDVTVYGIAEGSRYWTDLDVSDGRVLAGAGLLSKCGLAAGDTIVLYDKFADKSYAFKIAGSVGDSANTSIYMSQATFNEGFGHDEGWFCAYASDEELPIDATYLASTLTPADMQDLADEMLEMFSDTVQMILAAAALVFFVVMYLLTKTVLDHSARSISYMKVFGYRNREIRALYLRSITIAVAIALLVGTPLTMWLVSTLMEHVMMSYSGNFTVNFPPQTIAMELAIGFGTYLVVALLHMHRIRKVPLALALKTQE